MMEIRGSCIPRTEIHEVVARVADYIVRIRYYPVP